MKLHAKYYLAGSIHNGIFVHFFYSKLDPVNCFQFSVFSNNLFQFKASTSVTQDGSLNRVLTWCSCAIIKWKKIGPCFSERNSKAQILISWHLPAAIVICVACYFHKHEQMRPTNCICEHNMQISLISPKFPHQRPPPDLDAAPVSVQFSLE